MGRGAGGQSVRGRLGQRGQGPVRRRRDPLQGRRRPQGLPGRSRHHHGGGPAGPEVDRLQGPLRQAPRQRLLPPLPRGPRPHGGDGLQGPARVHPVEPPVPHRRGEGAQPGGRGLLPPALRRHARARHRADGDAAPLRAAAGHRLQPPRVVRPGDDRPVHALRRGLLPPVRREGRVLAHLHRDRLRLPPPLHLGGPAGRAVRGSRHGGGVLPGPAPPAGRRRPGGRAPARPRADGADGLHAHQDPLLPPHGPPARPAAGPARQPGERDRLRRPGPGRVPAVGHADVAAPGPARGGHRGRPGRPGVRRR